MAGLPTPPVNYDRSLSCVWLLTFCSTLANHFIQEKNVFRLFLLWKTPADFRSMWLQFHVFQFAPDRCSFSDWWKWGLWWVWRLAKVKTSSAVWKIVPSWFDCDYFRSNRLYSVYYNFDRRHDLAAHDTLICSKIFFGHKHLSSAIIFFTKRHCEAVLAELLSKWRSVVNILDEHSGITTFYSILQPLLGLFCCQLFR